MASNNVNVAFNEMLTMTVAAGPQALATATNLDSGTFVATKGNRRFIGLGAVSSLGTGRILTVQLLQATASDGTGKKALGDAATHTASGTETLMAFAEAEEEQLDTVNSFLYVGVRISHTHGSSADVASLLGVSPITQPGSNN